MTKRKNKRSEESRKQQMDWTNKVYNPRTYKSFTFRLNKITEVDLIEWFDSQANKNGLIRELLVKERNRQIMAERRNKKKGE